MKTIWKQQVPLWESRPTFEVEFPAGAEILSVGDQCGVITIWALVDSEAPLARYKFRAVFTGDSADNCDPKKFRGTVQAKDPKYHNVLVVHIFDAR